MKKVTQVEEKHRIEAIMFDLQGPRADHAQCLYRKGQQKNDGHSSNIDYYNYHLRHMASK